MPTPPSTLWRSLGHSRAVAYGAAILIPVALTYTTAWLNLPSFVFEHLVILVVLAVAIPWGLRPATVAVVVAVTSDNVLLQEPAGTPTISGSQDVLDLVLFAIVAIVVSGLVTQARAARAEAQRAADQERRAREDRDRLIATVTHDLATPLHVLNGTVQFARGKGGAVPDWSRLLERLATASARATSLVRMLSDAQALESDELGLAVKTHDLREVVAPIVQMMDRFSERHPVTLSAPEQPVLVDVDADRIQRVLENLVSNAIKYSPNGGVVEVSVDADEQSATLRVRDYGLGISPAALPHIFDRSFRAPEAAAHAPGLGLGLNISARVVARHRGTISAAAADGAGTVVTVKLPRAQPPMDLVTSLSRGESARYGR